MNCEILNLTIIRTQYKIQQLQRKLKIIKKKIENNDEQRRITKKLILIF